MMKIGIFGLGYVGLTTAACLLEKGLFVTGYEISPQKRELLSKGVCPLREPGVEAVLLKAIEDGRFQVRPEPDRMAVPDIVFICVGTPGMEDGSTDLRAVNHVFQSLADLVDACPAQVPEIVLRSTVPPGTLGQLGRRFPALFDRAPVLFYPEFLREGTAMHDFNRPPQTVLGSVADTREAGKIFELLDHFGFDCERVDATTAETLKFACNTFHALKVCFANEVGRLASACGGQADEVMRLFCRDTQLNISSRYLCPGGPYGGSCLPKDTRSLASISHRLGLGLELIKACEASNRAHFDHIVRVIQSHRPRVVSLLGFAFKPDTDDIRESPSLELLLRLATARVYQIKAHDFLVREDAALGVNARLIDKLVTMPDFSFHHNLAETLAGADLVVILHSDARYRSLELPPGTVVLDVAGWKNL